MQDNYKCKIASIEEIKERWASIIKNNSNNNNIYRYYLAEEENIEQVKKETRITYIGVLNNRIICDLTVIIKEEGILNESNNTNGLVNSEKAFLCGIRTDKDYENKGYFSKLYKYMENDLLNKGYKKLTISVEKSNTRAKEIYKHLGFTKYLRTEDKGNYKFDYYLKVI